MSGNTKMTAPLLASRLRALAAGQNRPFVAAVDGRSGTGKSTLAAALADELSAALVDGDDFFAGGVGLRDDPAPALARDCIDWRRQADVLRKLIAGRPASYHPFDWNAFDGRLSVQMVTIAPRPFIVVEGVYAARPEFGDLIDHHVLLRVAEDERMRRLLKREGRITAWERQWHRAEDWYFANVATPQMFDSVIG